MNIIVIKHIKKILIVLIVVFVIVAGVVFSEGRNYSSGIYDLPISFSLSKPSKKTNNGYLYLDPLSRKFYSGQNNTNRALDASDWDNFAQQFQNVPSGETIRFLNNIEAIVGQTNTSLGASSENNFIIDGQGFMLNSKREFNLGFRLIGTTLTFRDISFSSFNTAFRINGKFVDGGALYVNSGNVVFSGTVSFSHNRVDGGAGGALSATNHSRIDFNDSFVTFFDNEGVNGIAFSLFNSMANFRNSTVNFTSNTAISGWAFYMPLASSTNFINSKVNFIGNVSGGIVGGRLLNFTNSVAAFVNNRDVISGVASVNFENSNI
ncbi:MAG: hypothetical protein LBC92_05970, partial [Rickettsiales bacterium]|nr:hypothetical protein [Rickettsiales bacterium]